MIYYNAITWEVIGGSMVGRIRLSNGLWVTVIPHRKYITAQVQHPNASEQVFRTAEEVDIYLIKMCDIGGNSGSTESTPSS